MGQRSVEMIFSKQKNEKGSSMFTTSYKLTLSTIAVLAIATTLSAAEVGAITTFQANTTAKASEVNNNFITLKKAVNDNNSRLGTVETSKQNRVSGACGAGYYLQSINADGSVVCKADIDTNSGGDITGVTVGGGLEGGGTNGEISVKQASGYVSISNTALLAYNNGECTLLRPTLYSYFSTAPATNGCFANAPVNLPDKATITNVTCRVMKNDADSNTYIYVELTRHSLGDNSNSTVAHLETHNPSSSIRTLTATGALLSNPIVDNSQYSYVLTYDPPLATSTLGSTERFYNCRIGYTY